MNNNDRILKFYCDKCHVFLFDKESECCRDNLDGKHFIPCKYCLKVLFSIDE